MRKIIRHTLSAAALAAVAFSCKQEAPQNKAPEAVEIPADILEAANKWKKFESEADPLFIQALDHTDLGHEKFSFSKGNFFQYLYDAYKDFLKNEDFQKIMESQPQINAYLPIFDKVVEDSGLLSWKAGASSCKMESEGVYLNKHFLICEPGYEDKLAFSFLGGKERDLSALGRLPANTAFALSGTLNLNIILEYIKDLSKQYPNELGEVLAQQEQVEAVSQMMGIDYKKLSKEISQGATLVLTLDDKETIQVEKKVQFPRPEIMLMMGAGGEETKKIIAMFEQQGQAKKEVEEGVTYLSTPQNIPVLNKPGFIAFNETEYLIGTDKQMLKDYLAGKTAPSEDMKNEFAGIPRKGNGFFYLSSTAAGKIFGQIQKSDDFKKMSDYERQQMDKFVDSTFFAGVYSLKPEGMTAYFRSPFGGVGQSGMITVATIGMASAMVLPALGKARAKAQAVKVKNSLKQCGTGFWMYFADGTEIEVPKDYHLAFEWDLYVFEHPNLKFKPTSWQDVYSPASPWKFFIKPGQKIPELDSPEVPLMAVQAMKSGDQLLVLYGDGHVESKTVPGWRNMNLQQLEKAL